jgi:hypothetical protein
MKLVKKLYYEAYYLFQIINFAVSIIPKLVYEQGPVIPRSHNSKLAILYLFLP